MIDLDFNDIHSEIKGSLCPGKLKFAENAVVFKISKSGKVEHLPIAEIDFINWIKVVGKFGIRIFNKNGTINRFFGFKETDQDKVTKFIKVNYDMDVPDKELSVKGWNWGTAKFIGSVLTFEVNNLTAFDIALSNVSQCTTGKNEVTLEFHQNDETPVSLMEMRFHIPSSEIAGAVDPVEAFQNQVMQQASVVSVSGDAIAIFREIHCLTPRGRYDIKIFQSFFQLHGKTFDYKVPMSAVVRIFLLPSKDGRQHFLVVSLDPPIKQGQTRYHFLVLSFTQDDDTSIELPFTEEEIRVKYEGKITKELSGPTYEVLGRVMKLLVNRKITTPGAFKGNSGTPAISCSYKAAAGYIYPLERGFIYVHKPPVHIRFEEISCVNFARSGGSTRSFDFEVELTSGVVHTFSSIEKEEYANLHNFIVSKKLKVKDLGKADKPKYVGDLGDSDQKDAPDAYLERVKREGEEKDDDDDDDDGDDESTDEDFNPGNAEESDIAEEYDSRASGSDSDASGASGDANKPKQPKEKKEKPSKPKSTTEKPKKRKKNKDSNKPKRPPSAYMLWFNETREKIKTDNPGISFTDIGKKGGELWKTLGSREKEEYERKSKKAKEEYDKVMKVYIESGGNAGNKGGDTNEDSEKKPKKKSKMAVSPIKSGSGSHYLSKEFIEDDDSDSDGDNDKKVPSPVKEHKKEIKDLKKKDEPKKSVKKSPAKDSDSDTNISESDESDAEDSDTDKKKSTKSISKRKRADSSEGERTLPKKTKPKEESEEEIESTPSSSDAGSASSDSDS